LILYSEFLASQVHYQLLKPNTPLVIQRLAGLVANNSNTNANVCMEFYDVLLQVKTFHDEISTLFTNESTDKLRSMAKSYFSFWQSIGEESLKTSTTLSSYLSVAQALSPEV